MVTILVVDDRPVARELLSGLLGRWGYRVAEAGDGAQGLDLARQLGPDLVVSEVLMPTMDGREFARRLRADSVTARIPIIFHTALFRLGPPESWGEACGGIPVLPKPSEPAAIADAVSRALGSARGPAARQLQMAAEAPGTDLSLAGLALGMRLAALQELNLAMAAEREPGGLLALACRGAQALLGARHVAIGMRDAAGTLERLETLGFADDVRTLVGARDPEPAALAAFHAPARDVLRGEIASATSACGWLHAAGRAGDGSFTPADRQIASTLAAQLGMAWENLSLFEALRQSQRATQEREQRLYGMIDSAMDAIITVNEDREVVIFNGAAEQMFGYRREEILGQSLDRLLPDRFRAAHRQHIDRFAQTGSTGRMMASLSSLSALRANGEEFPVEASISQAGEAGRKVFTVILRDTTERRRAEEALRSERAQLRAVLDNAPLSIVITDADARILLANRAASANFGEGEPAAYAGRPLSALLPEGLLRAGAVGEPASWTQGAPVRSEETVASDDGRARSYMVLRFPVRYLDTGQTFGVCFILADITERLAAEAQVLALNAELEQRVRERTAQLEVANRELEAFSYSVSHDLKVPVRAVSGFAQILEEDFGAELSAEARETIRVIREGANRMRQLIDDLLAFSRIARNPLALAPVDMRRLAEEALEGLLRQHGRPVTWRIHDLPPARGDRALLGQVWINLLSNALKFSGAQPAPEIEVGALEEGGETVYYVADNGVGFDMRYYDKLFGVFQRLHRQEEFAGTGVGLAIVQRIVTRHGGRVWAQGTPGQGARFFFSLPKGGAVESSAGS